MHDGMGLKDYAAGIYREDRLPDFVGIRYYSLQETLSHLELKITRKSGSAQDFIDLRRHRRRFYAHPFRNNNRGLEENLAVVRGLDGVEVLNGSTSRSMYGFVAYARQYGYLHLVPVTVMCRKSRCVYDIFFQMRSNDGWVTEFKGRMKPAYYVQGGYRVLEVQNNDKKVQNSIKIPFTFPARSDSMYL